VERLITVSVAWGARARQIVVAVRVPEGSTVRDVLRHVAELRPGETFDGRPVGIYGRLCTLETGVRAGDRVELYGPLLADPKAARRARARQGRARS
jgi:uncharacterized protein